MSEGSVLLDPEQHPGDSIDLRTVRFARGPRSLRMFVGEERCYMEVHVRLADPLYAPDRYFSVVDSRDREICLVDSLDDLDPDSRRVVEAELGQFYTVPQITHVNSLSLKQGPLYWEVETNWGPREFVMHWGADTVMKLPDGRLRLSDVDGNRFDIAPEEKLDEESRKRVAILR